MLTNWLELSAERVREELSAARCNLQEARRRDEKGDIWGSCKELGNAVIHITQVIQDVNALDGERGGYITEPSEASVRNEDGYGPSKLICRSQVELERAESALAAPVADIKAAITHLAMAVAFAVGAIGDYHVKTPKLKKPILGRW